MKKIKSKLGLKEKMLQTCFNKKKSEIRTKKIEMSHGPKLY